MSNGQRDGGTDTRMVQTKIVDGLADVLVFALRNSSCIVSCSRSLCKSFRRYGSHTACFDHIQSSSKKKSSDCIATLSMQIAPFACSTYPTYPISPTAAALQSRGWQLRAVSFSSRKREISENSSRVARDHVGGHRCFQKKVFANPIRY